MDNSTIYKYYNLATSKGHSEDDIAGQLAKHGFKGGKNKLRQIVKGMDRKVKSAGKQIQKAEEKSLKPGTAEAKEKVKTELGIGQGDDEISKFVRGVIREVFSGISYEQYPKMVASIESRMEGTDYDEVLERIQGEMSQFTEDNPATAVISNITGGFISGYTELKILSGLGLLPKVLQLKSGQPIRNIARSGFVAGPLTAYPASIVSTKALRDRGVYEEPILDQEEVKNATFPPIMTDPSVTIPTAMSTVLGPVGDALGSTTSRVTRGVKSKLSPGGGEGNPRDPSGSIGDKSGPERSALSEISDRLERDQVPTNLGRQRIKKAGELGMDGTMIMADKLMTGPQTRSLAGRYGQTPSSTAGQGQQLLEQRITGRGNPLDPTGTPKFFQGPGMGTRVGNYIQDLMGIRVSPLEYLKQLKNERSKKAPAYYDQAYTKYVTDDMGKQVPVGPQYIDVTENMRSLFQRPTMQSAFKQAKKDALDDGFVLPDNLLELGRMTVQQFDYLQRGIKNVGQVGQRSNTMSDDAVRRVTTIRQSLLDDVDGQLRATNPAGISPYAEARSFWHDEMDYDRAFRRGQDLGKSDSVSADDVIFEFRQMSDAEKEAVKLGMVSGFLNKIEGKRATQEGYSIPDTGRFITERFEKILGGLFPDGTTVSDFIAKMRLETDTGATYNKIFQGSPTSVRETEQRFAGNILQNVADNTQSMVGSVRREMMNLGLGDLARKKLTQEAEAGGKRLFDPNPVNQLKTYDEVDEIRRMNQALMKRGLLTQGGLPSALTGIYPMSLLD